MTFPVEMDFERYFVMMDAFRVGHVAKWPRLIDLRDLDGSVIHAVP